MVKNLPVNARDIRDVGLIPGCERSLEKGMSTHSIILAWKISWTEEPGGLQSIRCKESDMSEATKHACTQEVNCFLAFKLQLTTITPCKYICFRETFLKIIFEFFFMKKNVWLLFFSYFTDFCSLFLLNFLIDTKSFSIVIMKLILRFFDQEPNRKLHWRIRTR